MKAFQPSPDEMRRLMPASPEDDIRMSASTVDSVLMYLNMVRWGHGVYWAEAVPWARIHGSAEKIIRVAATRSMRTANGISGAFDNYAATPYGVTVAHIGPDKNGHFVAILYSYAGRTVAIYDSICRPGSNRVAHVVLSEDGLRLINLRANHGVPPLYSSTARMVITWLEANAAAARSIIPIYSEDSMRANIRASMSANAKRFPEWTVHVMGMKVKQKPDDCGPMALAAAASLLAGTNERRLVDHAEHTSPLFFKMTRDGKVDATQPCTAEDLAHTQFGQWNTVMARVAMTPPISRTVQSSATTVRAEVSYTFEQSRNGGEDRVDKAFLAYSLIVAANDIYSRHVLQTCQFVYATSRARQQAVVVTPGGCDGGVNRLREFLFTHQVMRNHDAAVRVFRGKCVTPEVRAAVEKSGVAFVVSAVEWTADAGALTTAASWGARILESDTFSGVPCVVNCVLFKNVPTEFARPHIPHVTCSVTPGFTHVWAISMASACDTVHSAQSNVPAAKTSLANHKWTRALSTTCSFHELFGARMHIDVQRPDDVLVARYTNVGMVTSLSECQGDGLA